MLTSGRSLPWWLSVHNYTTREVSIKKIRICVASYLCIEIRGIKSARLR